jgi:hypothetical protein
MGSADFSSRPEDPSEDWGDVKYNWERKDPGWRPTELLDRLWQGGVPDDDLTVSPGTIPSPWRPSVHKGIFDACVTLTSLAGPVGTGVAEFRVTFPDFDGVMPPADLLGEAIAWAALRHSKGDRVLVRCHAGLSRSGLVVVPLMTWIDPSLTFDQALTRARHLRHELVLCRFEELGRGLARP